MSFGLAKDNKFEIIAILREELHKKTKLEVLCENNSVIKQLEKIDFERFVLSPHKDIVPEKVQYFILHSDSGIVKFSARYEQASAGDAQAGLSYLIPDMIFFAQQRQNQRFSFLKGYDFFCSGRYKNGENYSLKVKNISQGGCALIVKDVNARFLYKDAVIKGAALDFDVFGSLLLDLKVIDVVMINEFDDDNQLYSCYQISCEFDYKNRREEAEVEKIIIKFLMSNKIRSL
ncbi:pilus assembly protein PilZ [Citrobacter gillenii]|uniref:pilus assembly protein PilZ n=1 Tax=Citrobacter gillenii TaxID=67828 RepID=UPI003986B0E0